MQRLYNGSQHFSGGSEWFEVLNAAPDIGAYVVQVGCPAGFDISIAIYVETTTAYRYTDQGSAFGAAPTQPQVFHSDPILIPTSAEPLHLELSGDAASALDIPWAVFKL